MNSLCSFEYCGSEQIRVTAFAVSNHTSSAALTPGSVLLGAILPSNANIDSQLTWYTVFYGLVSTREYLVSAIPEKRIITGVKRFDSGYTSLRYGDKNEWKARHSSTRVVLSQVFGSRLSISEAEVAFR